MIHAVVFITVDSAKQAEKIANILVEKKLAACVNIVPRISSIYWWQGKIERTNELLLIVKTRKKLFKQLMKEVKSIHTYTVPEIIALPIVDGSPDYIKWISGSVMSTPSGNP
jgi:periplasmic divalent cation tolerance protein